MFKATLRKATRGCVLCYLDFEDESCYKTFLRAYRDGRLSETLTRELIKDDMRTAEGEDLYVHVMLRRGGGIPGPQSLRRRNQKVQEEKSDGEFYIGHGFSDVFIKQEPLSPVKVEPTQSLPSCSYATEVDDTKPTLEVSTFKSQQPLGLKTELTTIHRRPPLDFQKVRLYVKTEPHFHVKGKDNDRSSCKLHVKAHYKIEANKHLLPQRLIMTWPRNITVEIQNHIFTPV
ncbi:hypothetical protein Bbelb_037330 [Branchiostoma belcheri]|nr:hypothetical protein Bbelb_037330 [Branchiostoma belcheri]